jgi:hypothetical protein
MGFILKKTSREQDNVALVTSCDVHCLCSLCQTLCLVGFVVFRVFGELQIALVAVDFMHATATIFAVLTCFCFVLFFWFFFSFLFLLCFIALHSAVVLLSSQWPTMKRYE